MTKLPGVARRSLAQALGIVLIAGMLTGLWQSHGAAQSPPARFATRHAWRGFMRQLPTPPSGCFKASYPYPIWLEVPCTTAPPVPNPPASGPPSATVGNGSDYSAQVPADRFISAAVGSFERLVGVTSETGTGPYAGANAYTLQLNANFFTGSPACNGAANPSQCQGWQQFVYSNYSCPHCAYMQYWLIGYNNSCPSGWYAYAGDCYTNSNAVNVPAQPIQNLARLSLTGKAASGGVDQSIFSTGPELYSVSGPDSMVGLAAGWQAAEFNIFGDCCGAEADFNSGATLVVRTRTKDGSLQAPACTSQGFTGETNNLTVVPSIVGIATGGAAASDIVFTESSPAGAGPGAYCHQGNVLALRPGP